MSGAALLIAFIILIVVMVVAISKFHIHPFLSIMGVSLLLAIIAGLPLTGIPGVLGAGFSGAFSSLGIVIILGAMIGYFLEKTGAALKMADVVVKTVGQKRPTLAILIMGWIVSIPVFCDSGFVILNPIRKAMVKKTRTSGVAMAVALSAGLYTSHVLIPPTPGPIAAANSLGLSNNLLLVIGVGVLISIPALIAGYFFAKSAGKKIKNTEDMEENAPGESYDELLKKFGKLPSAFEAFAPIVVPILLMAISSILSMAGASGWFTDLFKFLGTPIIALTVGLIISVVSLARAGKMKEFYKLSEETLKTVGPILFVTAAGGVLGRVITEAGIVTYITQNFTFLSKLGILFPFLLAAILKTAQGSSTVAITTTAGIMGLYSAEGGLMASLGLTTPFLAALTVMAIGAGAMTVSHANDSYYWVVTNFGGMKAEDGYKTQTLCTLVMGVVSAIFILLISLIAR
ncbi:MAG: GntP family permease [Oscillospiraceae bacterium]|jgi:GntP family gluconate:H+ symporter|nr:GntP family permease [Oscillospiraceae bacterium]